MRYGESFAEQVLGVPLRPRKPRPALCFLMCVVFVVAIALLTACAAVPVPAVQWGVAPTACTATLPSDDDDGPDFNGCPA